MGSRLMAWFAETVSPVSFEALVTPLEKLRGLLGTTDRAKPVAICGCASVHTFGMRYGIDVALLSKEGHVLASRRDVAPGRLVSADGAWYALERPACSGPWPDEGMYVRLEPCEDEKSNGGGRDGRSVGQGS